MEAILDPDVQKQVDRMDKHIAEHLMKGIKKLEEEPPQGDIAPLVEIKGAFRLKLGKYRILYEALDGHIKVFKISGRDKAYKWGRG